MDVLDQLRTITRCRRCSCLSCQSGYENHDHTCTEGKHCINTKEKLFQTIDSNRFIASRAVEEIRTLREQVKRLTVENAKGIDI